MSAGSIISAPTSTCTSAKTQTCFEKYNTDKPLAQIDDEKLKSDEDKAIERENENY